ncbi:hypothetical protein [Roseibium sp. MMSF_3412]|uniref:hypothetical protein n=1 Tax=Roseibium sp. MMSF_3412 TaxID=3046712 RepID=UPI00273D6396|nr:hypothetical protein [Roseibium sp. MMSF_3412]
MSKTVGKCICLNWEILNVVSRGRSGELESSNLSVVRVFFSSPEVANAFCAGSSWNFHNSVAPLQGFLRVQILKNFLKAVTPLQFP